MLPACVSRKIGAFRAVDRDFAQVVACACRLQVDTRAEWVYIARVRLPGAGAGEKRERRTRPQRTGADAMGECREVQRRTGLGKSTVIMHDAGADAVCPWAVTFSRKGFEPTRARFATLRAASAGASAYMAGHTLAAALVEADHAEWTGRIASEHLYGEGGRS